MEGQDQGSLWAHYVRRERRLGGLLEVAQDGGTERDWSYLTQSLSAVIGEDAAGTLPELRQPAAYTAAYSVLRRAFDLANEQQEAGE